MGDETPNRPARKAHARDDAGGRGDEYAALQARAAFIQNWGWEFINSFNQAACQRGRAQHGHNQEAYEAVRRLWEETRQKELTLAETLDFLLLCHRRAPFLFFNGNTFAEIGRRLVDVLFADLPRARRIEAASLAAHYIAGVLDREAAFSGLVNSLEAANFQPGDRIRTMKGALRGTVVRVEDDGRIVWQPDGDRPELTSLPESLLRQRHTK